MKLFHKICIWVFSGMMGLSLGILFFLLSSMLRQGVDDVICYGKKEIDKNVSVIREKIQRESIVYCGKTGKKYGTHLLTKLTGVH